MESCTRLNKEKQTPQGSFVFTTSAAPEFTVEPQGLPVSHAALEKRRIYKMKSRLRNLEKAAMTLSRRGGTEKRTAAEEAELLKLREGFDRDAWNLFLENADPWIR